MLSLLHHKCKAVKTVTRKEPLSLTNKPQVGEQHERQNISSEVAQAFLSTEDFWSADYNISYNTLHTDATKTEDRIFPFRNSVVLAV